MYVDLACLQPHAVYHLMMQTVIPRPIAWVLTDNGEDKPSEDRWNLAPFSLFSVVCENPPILMFSVGPGAKGRSTPKDTLVNIQQRPHYVIHVAPWDLAQQVSDSSATLPHGVSEVTRLGLPLVEFDGWPMPRLEGARVAFACSRFLVMGIGNAPQTLIFGQVHKVWLDDNIVTVDAQKNNRITVNPALHDPLIRLGGNNYARLGEQRSIPRPD